MTMTKACTFVDIWPLWRPGHSLGQFEHVTLLNNSARHRVYKVTGEDGDHAVKVFPVDDAKLNTCVKEARLLHRLRHPAVVQIEAVFFEEKTGSSTGNFYLQMPFYANGALDEWVGCCKPDSLKS